MQISPDHAVVSTMISSEKYRFDGDFVRSLMTGTTVPFYYYPDDGALLLSCPDAKHYPLDKPAGAGDDVVIDLLKRCHTHTLLHNLMKHNDSKQIIVHTTGIQIKEFDNGSIRSESNVYIERK
jgi:hypothetical protein